MNKLARSNNKEKLVSYETSIKKSNELSMAKLSHGLTLNQMQLLAYAIYSTQKDQESKFIKSEFEKMFNLLRYRTEDAYKDSDKVSALRFSTQDLDSKTFGFTPVFSDFQYKNGTFTIEWNSKFIPHIMELKNHYVTTDLTITSQFKSSFSWVLYEYLKGRFGAYYVNLSKESLMRLFGVENRKTYQSNTGRFKKSVLDVAIKELNELTELEVWYVEKKSGRAIIGFELHWSTGKTTQLATKNQSDETKRLIEEVYNLAEDVGNMKVGEIKEKAIKIIVETEGFRKFDDNELYTSKEVGEYIPVVKANLKKLENYLEYDKEPAREVKPVPFYDWLAIRE